MSDLRLKKITVEPLQKLIIQNGDVIITNTTNSTNVLNGCLITDGGVGINCTYDSSSSTSGGALTIGGGLAVHAQSFFGNNVIVDNNQSVFSVNGILTNRLFLDSVQNKNFYISPDGINKRLNLYDTSLYLNITSNSTNSSSGAFVVQGGISINNTFEATSSTNGGALTVGGGIGISGNAFLSKNLTVGKSLLLNYGSDFQIGLQNGNKDNQSTLNMNGNTLVISNSSDILFNTTIGSFIFSNTNTGNTLFVINGLNSTFNKYVNIIDTTESLNNSSGCLIVSGGITIKCTTDSISQLNGGAITIAGGLGVSKKILTGDSIGIELSNSNKNNKLVLYQINSDVTQSHLFSGFGVTTGSLRFQLPNITSDYIFYSANSSGNTSNEVFRIKGNNEVQFIGINQRYSIIGGGSTNNDLSIQSQGISESLSLCLFTKDGDTNDNNDIKIFGLGLPNNITSSENLRIGWDTLNKNYIISSNKSGTGISRPIVLQSSFNIEQLKLNIDGTISISSSTGSINSSTGAFVVSNGGMSINCTSDCISLTNGGALTINGGISILKSAFIGNTLNISSSSGNISLYSKNTQGDFIITNPTSVFNFAGSNINSVYNSRFSLFSLNNTMTSDYQVFNISSFNNIYSINSNAGGSNGLLLPIQINVGNKVDIFMPTNGNIGINTTSPNFQLDINGTMQANNYNLFNQLTIYNTTDATSTFTSGCLTILGGVSIYKKLFVGGQTVFTNTTGSSSTSASVFISGGLTVASGESSNYGMGALTVNGGAYIGGELYIQQNLNVLGQINGGSGSSSSFAYLTLTATDQAINLTSGSLLTFGGITIQNYANSSNVSNGGSFLTPGGASIGKDLYIGENVYNYGVNNYYSNQNSLLNFYDNTSLLRFSIDRNTISNDLSFSRYNNMGSFIENSINISNNTGMITLNNTTASLNSSSGSIISFGGITINNTTDSTSLQNGGGITVFGGMSLSKRLFVGGDTVFSSTTNSTDVSSGSMIIHGGVGIAGNLNVLGNTTINGNLTIVGATSSIQSTNTLINDNIIVLNAGPSGSKDSGFIIQRYQFDNNQGSGDVVSDTAYFTNILPNQSGITNNQIKLNISASSLDDFYYGWWIKVTSGYSNNQVRKVTGYVGSTRLATLSTMWDSQNPSIGDSVSLYNKSYNGIIYSQINNRFEFGSTVQDPGSSSVVFTDVLPIYFSSATSVSTQLSISSEVGGIVIQGGLSISNTTDAISLSSGNALTIAGGASIGKQLFIGSNLIVRGINITPNTYDVPSTKIFYAQNNSSYQNFITMDSSIWGFDIYISIRLNGNTNLYSNYTIKGVNQYTNWEIVSNYIGDNIVTFNITSNGILQYSTPNYTGFSSLVFKYKIITN